VRTLVTGLRAGRRIDDLQSAARSTLAAILGRDAVAAGHSLAWPAVWPAAEAGSSQSVQSSTV
jgi:hypothetical protein